jgi:hypothetical protein
MSLYNVRDSSFVPNPVRCVRNLDMIKVNPKGKQNVSSVERKITRASIVTTIEVAQ